MSPSGHLEWVIEPVPKFTHVDTKMLNLKSIFSMILMKQKFKTFVTVGGSGPEKIKYPGSVD